MLEDAARLISTCNRAVALTGAGISVESGVPAFRGAQGLWEKYDPLEYARIDVFVRHPDRVWPMLLELHGMISQARPNAAHLGLARMEKLGYLQAIITQNIDNLHQAAGSLNVIEFHGSSRRMICMGCADTISSNQVDLEAIPPYCPCGGLLKPDIVFFGEPIPPVALSRAREESEKCDAMMVIGTSASVAPACDMPDLAKQNGVQIIELNIEETSLTHTITDIFVQGSAGELVPRLVQLLEMNADSSTQ